MRTESRDKLIIDQMNQLISKAKKKEFTISDETGREIDQICDSRSWGFREILLVIGIGKLLKMNYRPTTNLYDCNPRSLFEGPIRQVLSQNDIPHRKSGPLNIAKAAMGLDSNWAAQRRPKNVADIVVKLAKYIENATYDSVEQFLTALLAKLLNLASSMKELNVEISPESDIAFLSKLSCQLIETVPDGGNTPQIITGYLIEAKYNEIDSSIKVSGHEDSASVTNTTSKKPGDITVEDQKGRILKVFEVTVKPFNENRVIDSYDSIIKFLNITKNHVINEVTVICRVDDFHPDAEQYSFDDIYLGQYIYKSISYQFLEIFRWINASLTSLNPDSRIAFYQKLNSYIAHPNTNQKVKTFWKKLHKKPDAN